MKEDPLKGLTARQIKDHERHCARYFANYNAQEHIGWLAGELREGRMIIAERHDLDHPGMRRTPKRSDCVDCNANLQYEIQKEPPAICLACAYRRASFDC